MGYYIEVPRNHDKAEQIVELHGGEIVSFTKADEAMKDGKGVIVVIDNNGFFEAAGFAFDYNEFKAFTNPRDIRPRKFVVMNRERAKLLSGFDE